MKLISCHISNFGKLSDFKYDFNSTLNVINQQNGWGKTTFADFIKAMFYSLPTNRVRNLKDNPRKKYKPWNGGVFGGNLIFETNGNTYKIERTFGTTESEDTFKLFNEKTNKPSNDYSSNIGYELFGLDGESFSKTTYLPQLDFKIDLTDNISAKLNNLTQDKDDVNSYNSAISIIDEKRKIYQKTGERGKFFEIKKELEDISNKKETLSNVNDIISKLEEDRKTYTAKILKLETQKNELNKNISLCIENEKLKNIDKLKTEVSTIEAKLEEIKIKLHGSVPTLDELSSKRQLIEKFKEIEINLTHIQNEITNIEKELKEVNKFWNNNKPTDDHLNKIETEYNNFKTKNQNSSIDIKTYNTKQTSISFIVISFILLVSVLSILFAINIISSVIFAILLSAITIFSALVITFNLLRRKQLKHINNQLETNNLEITKLLDIFKYENNISIDIKMHLLHENISKFNNLTAKKEDLMQKYEIMNKKALNLNDDIESFISFYSNNDNKNASEIIYEITSLVIKYNETQKLLQGKQKEYIELSKKIGDTNNSVQKNLNLDLNQLNYDLEKVQKLINDNTKELSQINLSIERYKLKHDELDDLISRENELKTEFDEISKKLKILEFTDKYLKQAKEELDSKFIQPIADNFAKIVDTLNAIDIENFKIDTNFNILIEQNGQSKELSFFSKGYQDIAYISARIASIESMFEKDKPFIILDDPFVNLDKEKLELSKQLLKKLSKDYQIIYLVCHESRI